MSVESPNKTAHLWVFYCRNKKKDKQKRLPWQEAVFNVVDKTWQAIADRSAIWSNILKGSLLFITVDGFRNR